MMKRCEVALNGSESCTCRGFNGLNFESVFHQGCTAVKLPSLTRVDLL